jgi:hypothetical protein
VFRASAEGTNSGVRRVGFDPFEQPIRASPFLVASKASFLEFDRMAQLEASTSVRSSSVQAFGETRSAYYAVC